MPLADIRLFDRSQPGAARSDLKLVIDAALDNDADHVLVYLLRVGFSGGVAGSDT